ncbi:hypothetical protein [Methylorubrum aminovorans]
MYQENQAMELLDYALRRAGVDPAHYILGRQPAAGETDDRSVLLKESDGTWKYCFLERGTERRVARFESGYDATNFLFWKLTDQASYWQYREEWEASGSR